LNEYLFEEKLKTVIVLKNINAVATCLGEHLRLGAQVACAFCIVFAYLIEILVCNFLVFLIQEIMLQINRV